MTPTISLTHIVGRVKLTPIGEPKTSFYNITIVAYHIKAFILIPHIKISQNLSKANI